MVIPAADDPAEVMNTLWRGFAGELAFEVGANVGRSLARMQAAFTTVVAFEPLPATWEFAIHAVPGVDVWPLAISDHDGFVDLIPVADQLQSDTHEAYHRANPAERQTVGATLTVPCRTLDSLTALRKPDFINMDVEGHELAVLHGAKRLLADFPPQWLIEFHSKSLYAGCVTYLESFGYQVETVRHPHYPVGSVNWYEHGWLRAHPQTVALWKRGSWTPSSDRAKAIPRAAVPLATQ